jgi:hypothetical protein
VKLVVVLVLVLASSARADTWEWKVPEKLELVAGTSGTLALAA